MSTHALTIYRKYMEVEGSKALIGKHTILNSTDIWDTAGQETFNELHPSYYF